MKPYSNIAPIEKNETMTNHVLSTAPSSVRSLEDIRFDQLPDQPFSAMITSIDGAIFKLRHKEIQFTANLAASCLLRPQIEDQVLCSLCIKDSLNNQPAKNNREGYIIAVLSQASKKQSELSVEGNLNINCNGKLNILSQKGTEISGDEIKLNHNQTHVFTEKMNISASHVLSKITDFKGHFKQIHTLADIVSSRALQSFQKFNQYIRHTDQIDQVKAGQMAKRVTGLFNLKTKHSMLTSEKETKIDGEHIHMG